MLATFLVGNTTTVLGDDTNFAAGGRFAFRWESFSVEGVLNKQNVYQGATPFKAPDGNIDRLIGFRIGRSLGTIAAVAAFLKSIDALVLQQGSLTLQPDAAHAGTMAYANAILRGASLVPGGDDSAGMRVTISYKFECLTLA